jgi:hypothetical protein
MLLLSAMAAAADRPDDMGNINSIRYDVRNEKTYEGIVGAKDTWSTV